MAGGFGGEDVTVNIGGSAAGARAAAQEAVAALQELSEQLRVSAAQANYFADASRVLGASMAESRVQWLQSADGADVYAARLSYLRAELASVEAQEVATRAGAQELGAAFAGMSDALGMVGGGMSGMPGIGGAMGGVFGAGSGLLGAVGDLVSGGSSAAEVLGGLFTDGLTTAMGAVTQFTSQALSMVTAMAGMQIFQEATSWVGNFANEMMSLNETMQAQDVGWSYLYGDASGPNQGAASQLMGWSAQESYSMPYTRQDMNQAISILQMLGLSTEGIEKYLPVLSDLGVRREGLTLTQIAQAVMGAAMGYPRMMKYELALPDTALIPYGLDMNGARQIDPQTLLPALMAYSQSQSYYNPTSGDPTAPGSDKGAAWALSHDSLAGAMTSWTDRWQNALLNLGGTYASDQTGPNGQTMSDIQAQWDAAQGNLAAMQQMLSQFGGGVMVRDNLWGTKGHPNQYVQKPLAEAGDVQKGSFFDDIINGLSSITSWWDAHQPEINGLTDLFTKVMGQGLHDAGDALLSFGEALAKTGVGNDALKMVQDALAWLSDPKHQQEIKDLASAIGTDLGVAIKTAGDAFGNLKTDAKEVADVLGAGNLIVDLYAVALAFVDVNEIVEKLAATLTLTVREFADASQAYADFQKGDVADAQAQLADMGQAWTDYNNQIIGINQQTADSVNQLADAYKQYAQAQSDAQAANPGVGTNANGWQTQAGASGSGGNGSGSGAAPTRDGYMYPDLPPGYGVQGWPTLEQWNAIMDRYEQDAGAAAKTAAAQAGTGGLGGAGNGLRAMEQGATVGAFGPSTGGASGSGGVSGGIGANYTNVWHVSGATSLDLQRLVDETAKKQSQQIASNWRAAGGGGALFGTVGLGF